MCEHTTDGARTHVNGVRVLCAVCVQKLAREVVLRFSDLLQEATLKSRSDIVGLPSSTMHQLILCKMLSG